MDNKAQSDNFTPITMIFLVISGFIVWALFSGKFLNDSISMAMDTGYFTGFEGFILSNLGLIVFLVMLLAIIALGMYSTQQ